MANTSTIKDFFTSSEINRISIPKYQRNYSWSKEELRELWNDISNISVTTNIVSHKHFIGLVVLVESGDNSAYCDVVDGQQRITTITILLSVIRDIFTEEATKNLTPREAKKLNTEIQQINNLIFIDPTESIKLRKFIPNEQDKKFFFDITFDVGGESDGETTEIEALFDSKNSELNIFEIKTTYIKSTYNWKSAKFYKSYLAYEFFYESIKKQVEDQNLDLIQFLKELKKKVLEGVHLMTFKSSDETEAFNLFETLNDRGLGLAAADLIKNKILQRAISSDRDNCNSKWSEVFGVSGIIQNSSHNLFLRHFYNCHNKFISKQDLYSGYKSIILGKEPNEVLTWVKSLEKAASNYVNFRDVYDADGKFYFNDFDLQNVLVMLKKTGSLQWHTVAFALSKAINEDPSCLKECIKTYWLLFNLILRFSLLDVRFNYLEKRLPKIARSIWGRKKYSLDENETEATEQFDTYTDAIKYGQACIQQLIDQHVPDIKISDDIFMSDIRDNNLFNCILRLCYLGKVPHGHSLDGDLTLEHVLPIEHSKWTGVTTSDADAIKYKLGNGVLIRKDFNSSLQNHSLEDKHPEYVNKKIIDSIDNSSDLNVLLFTESSSWTKSIVNARTAEITKIVRPLLLNRNLSNFR